MGTGKSQFKMGLPGKMSALFLAFLAVIFAAGILGSLRVLSSDAGQLYARQAGLEGDIDLNLDMDTDNLAASDLPILHENKYPTRLALGLDNKVYVSDAKADAVFIYDAELNLVGELKGIDRPLGVAVGPDGSIYVGSDGDDDVKVYDPNGVRIRTIGVGIIQMPNDLVVDRDGWLYVADSLSDKIWIYDPNGFLVGSAGAEDDNPGRLDFPVAITIAYYTDGGAEIGELYVADQRHASIQVFDLQGSFLRAYGGKVTRSTMNWQGKFARIQSLDVDAQGRIHAADCYMNKVQILDADTGGYIDSYGEFGTAEGQLNLPLDILINDNKIIVANAENNRVEVIYTIP